MDKHRSSHETCAPPEERPDLSDVDGAARSTTIAREKDGGSLRARLEESRTSIANLEASLSAAGAGDWQWNLESNQLVLGDSWLSVFGYLREAIGSGIDLLNELTHPEDRSRVGALRTQFLDGANDLLACELRIRSGAGHYLWVLESARVVERSEQGRPLRVVGLHQDITRRRETEKSLRDTGSTFRQLADRVREVFWICTADGKRTLYVSPAYEEIWGGSRQSLYENSEDWPLMVHPEDRDRVVEAAKSFVHGASPSFHEEYRIVRPDGTIRWVRVRGFPVIDELGKTVRTAGIAEDITEARTQAQNLCRLNDELETRVRERTTELERSNKALEEFAYIASHDLQEPLRMVTSYVQLLEQRCGTRLDQDGLDFMRFIVDGAQRMKALINDLLAYSRMEISVDQFEEVDVQAALKRVLGNLSVAIEESNAEITSDPLPVVSGIELELIQLLQNLIGNAIKYRREKPRIHVSATHAGGEWWFSVKDNGIGIDPQHFDRIFRIFQRLRKHGEVSGTGIGLAICKKIVERHGGRIWVDSKPDDGSVFLFTLPRDEIREPSRATAAAEGVS